MDYTAVNPRLPEWAAKKAISVLTCRDVSSQDREDMTQEAALTIWRVAGRAESEGYLYNAGKYAALQWWRHFVAQVKHYDDGKKGGFVGRIFSLDAEPDDALPRHERVAAQDKSAAHRDQARSSRLLSGERQDQIRKLFRERGPWTRDKTVDRALQVLRLALASHNTESIALELDMTTGTVNAYRRKIRAVLQQVCEERQSQAMAA